MVAGPSRLGGLRRHLCIGALSLAEAERRARCVPMLAPCLPLGLFALPHFLAPFLSHMITAKLGLPQSYPKKYTVVSLRASKVLLPWPELRNLQTFTALRVEIQCQGVPGLGAAQLQLPGEGHRGSVSLLPFSL